MYFSISNILYEIYVYKSVYKLQFLQPIKKTFATSLKKQRTKSEEREIYNLTVGELSENADYNPL